jgi:hypothetical protein
LDWRKTLDTMVSSLRVLGAVSSRKLEEKQVGNLAAKESSYIGGLPPLDAFDSPGQSLQMSGFVRIDLKLNSRLQF